MKDRIFSGEYSRPMWADIHNAASIDDLKGALYLLACRLQEFESRVFPETHLDLIAELRDMQERLEHLTERIKQAGGRG